jgi:hypothetical protein
MFKVVITSIRPNINNEFFRYDSDLYDYIDEAYIQDGRLFGRKVSVSDDLTTETCIMVFDKKESWIAYKTDPIIHYQDMRKVRFNMYYKIAVSTNAEEITVTKDLYSVYLR